MRTIAKNVLVNAAKSTDQDLNKTLELAAGTLNDEELVQAKAALEAGHTIDWSTIDSLS
jgi:hypothetical protein